MIDTVYLILSFMSEIKHTENGQYFGSPLKAVCEIQAVRILEYLDFLKENILQPPSLFLLAYLFIECVQIKCIKFPSTETSI